MIKNDFSQMTKFSLKNCFSKSMSKVNLFVISFEKKDILEANINQFAD